MAAMAVNRDTIEGSSFLKGFKALRPDSGTEPLP